MVWLNIPIRLALACFLLASTAAGESAEHRSTRIVYAEGNGVDKNESSARELAITDALQTAVEKAAASYFSTSAASARQVLAEKILPKASDYIRTSKLIPETYQRSGNHTRLSLHVEVDLDVLERDLRSLGLTLGRWTPPRVMFLLKEEIDQQPSYRHIFAAEFQHVLSPDIIIVAPRTDFDVNEKILAFKREAEIAAPMQIGFQNRADFLIIGEAVADYAGSKLVPPLPDSQYYYHANVWAKVIRSDNGQILALQSLPEVRASSIKSLAADDALRRAARKLAESILEQLNQQWQREFVSDRPIELLVRRITAAQTFALESKLLEIPGILDAGLRYYETDAALFDVAFRGPLRGLHEGLRNLQTPILQVERLTPNRLELVYGRTPSDTVQFEINAPSIEVDSLSIADLFPAQLFYYARHPVGYVRIKNNTPRTYRSLKLSVHIPEVMNAPTDTVLSDLRLGQALGIPFSLQLAKTKLQKLHADLIGQCTLTLTYFEEGNEKQRKLNRPVLIHDPNAMDWREVGSIGAFINPESKAVMSLTARIFERTKLPQDANPLHKAAAIWEGLRGLKMRYQLDPYTAYRGQTIDYVKFPAQTLNEHVGDCDDLTVLFISCLENQGIPTALLITPTHVLPMFNTGISSNMWHQLSIPRDRLIEWQDQIWIPVEATYIAEDFDMAWRVGKSVYDGHSDITILDTRGNLQAYPPFQFLNEIVPDFLNLPVIKLPDNLSSPSLKLDPNREAHLLTLAGKFDEARNSYLDLFQKNFTDAGVINNLGNIYLMMGLADSALSCYDRAIVIDPADTALYFNVAVTLDLIVSETQDGYEKSLLESQIDSLFDILINSKKALKTVEQLLGEDPGVRAARPDERNQRNRIKMRIQKKLEKAKKRGNGNKTKIKPTRSIHSKEIRPQRNSAYVYWKFSSETL